MSEQVKIEATEGGSLILTMSDDGDVWVNINSVFDKENTLRFCTMIGGGKTNRTRRALIKLMAEMVKDGGESK